MGKAKQKGKTSPAAEGLQDDTLVHNRRTQPLDADETAGASIEKIRDILFGVQMRDYEGRFGRLEEHLLREVTDLRDETRKRLDSLEQHIGKEVESLSARLMVEEDRRDKSIKDLSNELKDTKKSIEKSLDQLDDQFNKSSDEFRQLILEQSKTLSDDIRLKNEQTSTLLEQTVQKLQGEKVDRSALSELLTQVALRLTDNLATTLNVESGSLDDE